MAPEFSTPDVAGPRPWVVPGQAGLDVPGPSFRTKLNLSLTHPWHEVWFRHGTQQGPDVRCRCALRIMPVERSQGWAVIDVTQVLGSGSREDRGIRSLVRVRPGGRKIPKYMRAAAEQILA